MIKSSSSISKLSIDKFDELLQKSPELNLFINNLTEYGELILVGGAVRDLFFNNKPRDLDIVVNSDTINFENSLKKYRYKKNRFDGYKVQLENISLDVWSIKKHWAFDKNILNTSVDNISNGAFYNFDSISMSLNSKKVNAEGFIDAISENKLDINFDYETIELNPTHDINVVKAFIINKYWGLNFSEKVRNYISEWLFQFKDPFKVISNIEINHYGYRRITTNDIEKSLKL